MILNTQHTILFFVACLLSACSSAPQIEQDRFGLADSNKDDNLSRKEASDAVVRAVFNKYDANQDGMLTFAEWKQSDATADAKLFAERDANQDGHVTLAEAQASADRFNVFGSTFKEGDTNGDGLLSRDEAAAYSAKTEGSVR